MTIELNIPSMLADATGSPRKLSLTADTLAAAIERIKTDYPKIAAHVFDDAAGKQRKHVLIFYNEESIAWLDRIDIPLKSGDRVSIVQAISGG